MRFTGTVIVPGVSSADPQRLHIASSIDPATAPPDPAVSSGPHHAWAEALDGGDLGWTVEVRKPRATLAAQFWYDADGNQRADPDEPRGGFVGAQGRDRGLFRSNAVEVGPVTLDAGAP